VKVVTVAASAPSSRCRGGFRYVPAHEDRLRAGLDPRLVSRRQHDALAAACCDEVFIDKASGKLTSRPELDKALLSANRAGDQLVVTKLDRLGRSLEHLIELSKLLQTRGVDLVVLARGSTPPIGRLFFSIIGAVAEFEHALMSERTMEGLSAAARASIHRPSGGRERSCPSAA
jgi:DNA invertase Pin-like site-specific DNA recombinase